MQHVGRKLPLLVLRLPTDLAFTPLPLTIAMTLVVVVHVTYIHTHKHTHAHREYVELHTTGACVRRVYIGATWCGSQPTTSIHVAYIARYIPSRREGGQGGEGEGVLGLRARVEHVVSFVGRLTGGQALAHILMARIGIQCCSF